MKRLLCAIRGHADVWLWAHFPDPVTDAGFPAFTPRKCQRCGRIT